jgi:hypothetical protein
MFFFIFFLLMLLHGSLGSSFLVLIPWVCEIGTRNRGESTSRRRRRIFFFFYKAGAVRYHQCFLEVVGVGMMMIPVAAAGPEAQLKRLGNKDAHVHEDEAEQKHTHTTDADQRKPPHLHIAAHSQTLPACLPKTSTTTRLATLLLPQLHHHNFSHSVPNTLRCLLVCKPPNSLTHTGIPTILSSTPPNQPQNQLLLAFFFFSFFFFFFFLLLFSLFFFFFLFYTKLITKCSGCTSGLESCSRLS